MAARATLPGFTAERALMGRSQSSYRSGATLSGSQAIVPQQVGVGPNRFGSISGGEGYICGSGTCPIHRCCVAGNCIPCRIVQPTPGDSTGS